MKSTAASAGTGTPDSETRHASGLDKAFRRLPSVLGLITIFNRELSAGDPIETSSRISEMRGNALEFALPGQW
jgi:hypothetical protein